jgi:hypothetical protein
VRIIKRLEFKRKAKVSGRRSEHPNDAFFGEVRLLGVFLNEAVACRFLGCKRFSRGFSLLF